jgi:hypothetical protein
MRVHPTLVCSCAFMALLAAGSCSGDKGPTGPETPTTISLAGTTTPRVPSGTSIALAASVIGNRGGALTGVTLEWTSTDLAVATVAGGVVTAIKSGTTNITASVGTIRSSPIQVTVIPGVASTLVLTVQPKGAVSGVPLATQPRLEIRDAAGNVVTNSTAVVTATIASGGGALGGTRAVTALNGVAVFENLRIDGSVGSRTLTFASPGVTAAVSDPFALSLLPASVAANAGDLQSAEVNMAVAVPPSVIVRDALGVGVAGVAVNFAVGAGGGTVAGGNTTSDISGIATVGSWTLGPSAGANTLTATVTGSGISGNPVTFTASAHLSLALTTCSVAQAGDYFLDASLSCANFSASNVSGVRLDCRGRSLGHVTLTGVTDFQIVNCSGASVELFGSQRVVVRNGHFAGTGLQISAVIVAKSGGHNTIVGNTIDGLWDGVPWDGVPSHPAVGADDGILVYDETDDVIQDNTMRNIWDAGIEGVGTVANTLIDRNAVDNAAIAGIGAYYNTVWRGNTVSSNAVSRAPVMFLFQNSARGGATLFAFTDNRFLNNRYAGQTSVSLIIAFLADVAVQNNLLQGNQLGTTRYSLSPASGFVDGGGNICALGQVVPIRCISAP